MSKKTFGLPRILSVLSLVPLSPYTFSLIHSCSFSIVSCLRRKGAASRRCNGRAMCEVENKVAQPSLGRLLSAPDHSSGCPEPRAACASLGPSAGWHPPH